MRKPSGANTGASAFSSYAGWSATTSGRHSVRGRGKRPARSVANSAAPPTAIHEGRSRLMDVAEKHLGRVRAGKHGFTGQHEIEDAPEGIKVGPRGGVAAGHLLGGDVGGRAGKPAIGRAGRLAHLRQT